MAAILGVVDIPDTTGIHDLSPWIHVHLLAPLGRHLVDGKLSRSMGLVFLDPDGMPVSTTVAVALVRSSDIQDVDVSLLCAIECVHSGSLRLSFSSDVPLVFVFWRHALHLLGGPYLDSWWFDLGPCPPRHLRSLLEFCLDGKHLSLVSQPGAVSPTVPYPRVFQRTQLAICIYQGPCE